MSIWRCRDHGMYGGQVFCPQCNRNGEFVDFDVVERCVHGSDKRQYCEKCDMWRKEIA